MGSFIWSSLNWVGLFTKLVLLWYDLSVHFFGDLHETFPNLTVDGLNLNLRLEVWTELLGNKDKLLIAPNDYDLSSEILMTR